jgi:hypothetical protein
MYLTDLEKDLRLVQLIRLGIVKVVEKTITDPETGLETVVRRLQFPVGLHKVEA